MITKFFNMRSVATIVACLAAMTMFSACEGKDDPTPPDPDEDDTEITDSNWQQRVQNAYGINLNLPEGWSFKEGDQVGSGTYMFHEIQFVTESEDFNEALVAFAQAVFDVTEANSEYGNFRDDSVYPDPFKMGERFDEMPVSTFGDATTIGIWYFATSDGRAIQCSMQEAPDIKTVQLSLVYSGMIGDDGGGDDNDNDFGPGTGGDPTLPTGYIWVDDNSSSVGMLFEEGNVYYLYYNETNDQWSGREQIGTWDGGNTIVARFSADPNTTFTVDVNTLYEYRESDDRLMTTFTKTAGTILGQTGGGEQSGSFVGTWIGGQMDTGRFTINDDNTWSIGSEAPIVGFVPQYVGTYTISAGTATFIGTSAYDTTPITGTNTAVVNGNTLTLNAGGSLMTSFGATWTRQN